MGIFTASSHDPPSRTLVERRTWRVATPSAQAASALSVLVTEGVWAELFFPSFQFLKIHLKRNHNLADYGA